MIFTSVNTLEYDVLHSNLNRLQQVVFSAFEPFSPWNVMETQNPRDKVFFEELIDVVKVLLVGDDIVT